MSWLEIVILVLLVLLPIGELYLYTEALWWHAPKADRRNWPPPR